LTADDGVFYSGWRIESLQGEGWSYQIRNKDDQNLYTFISNIRKAQRDAMSGKGICYTSTEDRIAVLDAMV